MRKFRRKFTKTNAFDLIILVNIISLFGYLAILDRPIWCIYTIMAIVILLSVRAISSCSYLIVTDDKIACINPYIRYYREFLFDDIIHAEIGSGGVYAYDYLRISTRDGKRFRKEIELVRRKDLNEIINIFETHGIEVEKFWDGYIE